MKLLGVWPKPAPGADLSKDPVLKALSEPISAEDLARWEAERKAKSDARYARLKEKLASLPSFKPIKKD